MNDFKLLYKKIVNKPLMHHFDEYFDINFFVFKNEEKNTIEIKDNNDKNYDQFIIKCRKLSIENWDLINDQEDTNNRQHLMLMFSIVETNFMQITFDKYGFMNENILDDLLKLHVGIIKYIVKKINEFYNNGKDINYRKKLTAQFKRLYTSNQGVKLQYNQISDFLTYCNFWQKLGLNYFQVKQLPYDVYQTFSMLMSIEIQVKNAEMKKLTQNSRRR